MNKHTISIALILCLLGSVHAFNLVMPDYTLEGYAQYDSVTWPYRMVFDNSGNLYVNHYDDGKIIKVNTNQEATTLATGLGNIYDITWGGGTGFGEYLYISSRSSNLSSDRIMRVNLDGTSSYFAPMTPPRHGVTFVGIDRTGNYGGAMFSSGSGQDRLYSIDTNGSVTLFADWPGWTDGGGPRDIGFDTTGKYGSKMYVATAFQEADSNVSGLFMVNPDASVSRFCNDLVAAYTIDIDTVGTYFDQDMFVLGTKTFGATSSIWRVYEDGTCEEFMTDIRSFAFGTDGAMYVSSYDHTADVVTIARVVPATQSVSLDIKPQSCPNPLNVKSKGILQAAILGSDELDVMDIDAASLNILGVQPIRSTYRDVATAPADPNECDCVTEGKDGYIDLLLRFDNQELAKAIGPVQHEDWITLTLEGFLLDGTPIEGADCVIIQKKGNNKEMVD